MVKGLICDRLPMRILTSHRANLRDFPESAGY